VSEPFGHVQEIVMMTMRELNEGEFQECDFGNYFTYRKTTNNWAIEQGFMHEIDVGDGGVRFARVLKTVAYVCVDEDEYGKAVFEKWNIKNHSLYRDK
jgi:hypothetical protein